MEPQALNPNRSVTGGAIGAAAPVPRGIGARILHEAREALAPTLFFFVGFNFIVLTTNLLLADYSLAVASFMAATVGALIVGKAVLVANAMPYIRRYDRAPLLRPILFKTVFYSVIVFIARLLERFIHFAIVERNPPGEFLSFLTSAFSWHRFFAINLWIFVLFLIYVTATELGRLFGPGENSSAVLERAPLGPATQPATANPRAHSPEQAYGRPSNR